MSQSRSTSRGGASRGRKRSAKSPPLNTREPKTTTRTTSTTVYSRNFEQKLIDHGYYPEGYEYPDGQISTEPDNWEEIDEALTRPRPSLSPSNFTKADFQKFKRADRHASKENPVMASVIPIIEGDNGDPKCVGGGYPLGNFAPLIGLKPDAPADAKPELAQATPDRLYGARPEQLDRRIRDELCDQIIPSTQDSLPILPNFFLEVKGPDGSPVVVTRQACYDGALGARGIRELQTYKGDNTYDNKAYTITSTYIAGMLKIYTHHITPSKVQGRDFEYITTQLTAYAMTGDHETFVRGASAYRNLRDWAKEQRDRSINDANERYLNYLSTSERETSELPILTVDEVETPFGSEEPEFHDAVGSSENPAIGDVEASQQQLDDEPK